MPGLRFGSFHLDRNRRVLLRGSTVVALTPRAFDLLCVLVEGRDRVVGRSELVRLVWPDQTVEDHNLSVQMSKLRQALGREADRIVATVPGRGYRFVATVSIDPEPVEQADAAVAAPPPGAAAAKLRRRAGAVAMVACLALSAGLALVMAPRHRPPVLSIVVMPLRDLSDHAGEQYLVDAVTDDLTTDLARLPGGVVIARGTAAALRDGTLSATAIGHLLSVNYLLEGSMSVEPSLVHINVQLIETTRGAHVWARRFNVPRASMEAVRDAIIVRVADALDHALADAVSARVEHERPDDPDAVDLFFRARSLLDHDDTYAAFSTAQNWLERAVALRPDFAEAQAELGRTLLRKVRSTDDHVHQADDLARADQAIAAALHRRPDLPDALAARAQAEMVADRLEPAQYSAEAALALDASNIPAREVLSACAAAKGEFGQAADALEIIVRLDPEGVQQRQRALRLGYFRLLQGRPSDAEAWLNRSIAGDPDPRPGEEGWNREEGARMLLVVAAAMQGQAPRARALYAEYDRIWPRRTVWRLWARAPKALSMRPEFARLQQALRAAGMPDHAIEASAPPGAVAAGVPSREDFAATPFGIAGAVVLDTVALRERLNASGAPPLVLDIGSGAALIPGASWQGPDGGDGDRFLHRVLDRLPERGRMQPVVVMSDGQAGSESFDAASGLVARGYRRVMWYRGGEEAWAAAGLPAVDARP